MSTNLIIEMWNAGLDTDRANQTIHFSPDQFRLGIDYLSLVSGKDFDDFLKQTIGEADVGNEIGYSNALEWICACSSNEPSSVLKIRDISKLSAMNFPIFLDKLRATIWKSIGDVLANQYAEGMLPDAGNVLYFTDNVSYVYIISYHMHYDRPVVEIIDRIPKPTGLFEIEHFSHLKNHRSRNRAKNYLTSGHKIIMQRGVLSHVDRRLDKNVFGPTIDTVLLADILVSSTQTCPNQINSFLEIGSGNGHISATAASLLPNINQFVSVDINEFSTSCTVRNIRTNMQYFHRQGTERFDHFYAVTGAFDVSFFRSKYDLIVSNPPYIMEADLRLERFAERFSSAVSGTGLIGSIIKSLPELLSPKGRLLLMTSSVSQDIKPELLSDAFTIRPALDCGRSHIEVPFDVEEVLDQKEWLETLMSCGALKKVGKETYTHELRPVWIERRSKCP